MSSHPNRVPPIVIRKQDDDVWLWECRPGNTLCAYSFHAKFERALSFALNHCQKAAKP